MSIESEVNQCFRKKVFRSEGRAQMKAKHHNKVSPPPGGKVFHAYYCNVCFHYHVGRTSNPR